MTRVSYVNGKFIPHEQAFVHIEDRGFQFADGIYEVILFYKNKLIDFGGHIERLFASLNAVKIKFNLNQEQIRDIVLELFAKNNLTTGSVYIQITRGQNSRNQLLAGNVQPTFVITVTPLKSQFFEDKLRGISVMTDTDMRWSYCNVKSIGLLASSMAKQNAVDLGYDDAILIRDDFVTEATFANVFVVNKDGVLLTRNDSYVLGGITRDRLVAIAKTNGIEVIEEKFSKNDLLQAEEVFLSATTLVVCPVIAINGRKVGNGDVGVVTQKLAKLYQQFLDATILL